MFTQYKINYSSNFNSNNKKYLMFGGMNTTLTPSFIQEINTIYSNIVSMYSHGDTVILSGSGALLYYLHILGYTDLIEELTEPNDVDFLLATLEPNATISVPFIGDHKRKQTTLEKSATFENNWTPNIKFKTFDLTIPRNSINWNKVGQINLITLNQLKSYYSDDFDIRPDDIKKIQIIDKIQTNLRDKPQPGLIGPEQNFRPGKGKSKQVPINYEPVSKISKNLFSDEPSTPATNFLPRVNLFSDEPTTPPTKTIKLNLFP